MAEDCMPMVTIHDEIILWRMRSRRFNQCTGVGSGHGAQGTANAAGADLDRVVYRH
jgi:hypothetical protein